ncbi:selenocysteine-specific translation elongation factor [Methyloterricola oryzae]|uniref:selenocysteine-specific translation elongation factor n=1 Tax=Methyloterricola oryzae TaxID=1495050 RepID=UPI0005EB3D11|nr:selenocysteine-specific translation elongation factor [Methyloterricola oryzae]
MIVGTAGHIDHGKTGLVKALTGVDADRLAEEKARGITIDLGYAYTPLAGGDILGFVDVPGHEKFIHNMLAGTTGIDFALLVVAADDGPMPQTLEHLQILDLLGVSRGAVALSKCDRVDAGRIGQVTVEIQDLLKGTTLAASPVFPLSAATGQGVEALKAHLESAAASLDTQAVRGGFRLAIDRCFSVAGAGTVVTGTVFSGRVRVGERLLLSPSGLPVRVRGIHAQNRPAEVGRAGQRCALNLADVEKARIQRGDWVLTPELHQPTARLDVRLRLLPSEGKPLRYWTPVHVHLGAFHATARVALLRDEPLEPGSNALAQLVLDRPTGAVHGDRAVLRDASALRTIAGGHVLDAQAPARGRRSPQRLEVLAAWEQPGLEAMLTALLAASPQGLSLKSFALNANLTCEELNRLLDAMDLRRVGGIRPVAFEHEHWSALCRAVLETLSLHHVTEPDSLGLNSEQLRLRCAPRLDRAGFVEVLTVLFSGGFCARDGSWWHLPGHEIVLAEKDEALWQRLFPLLAAQPFQPPRVRDIARSESLEEGAVRRLLSQAARLGRLHRVAHDHYFDRAAVAQMADIVRNLAREAPDGAVTAAAFRDRIGTGRKLAIHILEYFDRCGLTRRTGDVHRIRSDSLQF